MEIISQMVATLNYDLKDAPSDLFEKCRWSLLTMMILHANVRNRCWPSMRGLAARLNVSLPYATQAKSWLLEHEAIKLVPYKERVDKEKELSNHHHVYQLTGYIKFGDQVFQYLYIADKNGDNDQPGLSSRRVNDQRHLPMNQSSMVKTVDSQNLSPLSIPIEESSIPSKDKDSMQTAKAVAVNVPDHVTQPHEMVPDSVQPSKVAEPLTPCNPLPALDPPYQWYTVAGDNLLVHIAKPTPSGKNLKMLCGCQNWYPTAAANNPIGKREPCQQCQRELANRTALAAKAKAPKPQKPPDKLFTWVCDYLEVDPAVAWTSPRHVAFVLQGYLIREEKHRLKLDSKTPLPDTDRDRLAGEMAGFLPWYHGDCGDDCHKPTRPQTFETWVGKWFKAGKPSDGNTANEWVNVEVKNDMGQWVERSVHKSELASIEWRKIAWIPN